MKPLRRIAVTVGAMLVVGLIAAVFRMLIASGVFTEVTPGFAGTCNPVAGVTGPEDIAVDGKSGLAFVSATDRPAKNRGKPSAGDGLYVYAAGSLKKLDGTPKDFHPHGISLYRAPDGTLTLMAINHRMDGTSSIDIFNVKMAPDAVGLQEVGRVESDLLISPNAIAAVDAQRFYVVNDHTSKTQFGRWLDDNLVLPRANVLYFDGLVFRVAADHLVFPNGAALSADGTYLYVSESYNRQLRTFDRSPISGVLGEVNVLAIPSNLDNVRVDDKGNVWVASHPKAFAMAKYRTDPSKPAPSEVFEVSTIGGIPQAAKLVYANLGDGIGASSVAAPLGERLLIGSPFDDKILDCTRPD
jgi:arylesterase/paraoxonase